MHDLAIGDVQTTGEHELSTNTLITGGSFVTVEEGGVFQNHTHIITETRKGMRTLGKRIAPGAFHNSAERYDPPKCHPKTREAVLKDIMDWIRGLGELERRHYFMWLYGPAGAGKSAIAQTIAELCYEMKLLAASFFFSRTALGRNDDSRLIATLTYQLCLSIPEIRTYVEDAVELDPNVFSLSLETQLRKLIIEPFSRFHNNINQYHGHVHPRLIIIDGLDECATAIYVQRCVLQILADKLPIPMFFLVASRPEPHIREFFTADPMASITTTLALDDSYLPDADIKIFLEAKFNAIKRDHPLNRQLPESWPSTADVDSLVRKSSGQFIYASTVMKYVESHRHWPTKRLEIIFGIMSRGRDTPFADLDALYSFIFSSVEDIDKVLNVFCILLFVQTSSFHKTPAFIEGLLALPCNDLKITLIDLHSILDIPALEDGNAVRILHASLGDFLLDQTRSGNYHINQGHAHANLAQHLINCVPQKVIDNLELSTFQKFSCVRFIVHCTQAYPTVELLDVLWNFNTQTFWPLYLKGTFIRSLLHDISPRTSRGSQLWDFFTWLKTNGSSREGQSLYSHYILTWDEYIQHSLTQLSLGSLAGQCIVFFVLPQFHGYRMNKIFSRATCSAQERSVSTFFTTLHFHDCDSRYELLLTEFFNDPSRSGPFYLDGDKYAGFAITFTQYLIQEQPWEQTIWEDHLSRLSILLTKASYSNKLAALLDSELLKLVTSQEPHLAQRVTDIAMTYCNNGVPNEGITSQASASRVTRLFRWIWSMFFSL